MGIYLIRKELELGLIDISEWPECEWEDYWEESDEEPPYGAWIFDYRLGDKTDGGILGHSEGEDMAAALKQWDGLILGPCVMKDEGEPWYDYVYDWILDQAYAWNQILEE